jgi:hypothetical protein
MLSSNVSVRKAYYATLSTIQYEGVSVPVFWNQLPTTISPGIYIIFSNIRNNDQSNKGASVTQTSVTVSVYTNSLKYNDGTAVEFVANEVLNRIYKSPQFKLPLDTFFQVIQTRLTSDITNNFSQDRQNVYIDRILVFNHTIFQNVS